MSHNFVIVNADTDSISFCKSDGSSFSIEERTILLNELNSLYPPKIHFEDDGYFKAVLVLKAKNYVLQDFNGKLKTKGSAIRNPNKELALREFILKVIERLLDNQSDQIINDYNNYALEIFNIKDIKRWTVKKTITDAVLNPERTNEQKVSDAIQGSEYKLSDKAYFYFDVNENLKLQEQWNNDHNTNKLLEKLFKTIKIFESVLDVKQFPNYTLKRNQDALQKLIITEKHNEFNNKLVKIVNE